MIIDWSPKSVQPLLPFMGKRCNDLPFVLCVVAQWSLTCSSCAPTNFRSSIAVSAI